VGLVITLHLYTRGGGHYKPSTYEPSADQSKAFRKNYAGIGHIYDKVRDAFYTSQPFNSWTLNEDTCQWDAPVANPNDGKFRIWNEDTQTWDIKDDGWSE